MTAPVSAGSVSTRIACGALAISISGRQIRSKNRETGRNASFTVTSGPSEYSSCWSTGSGLRLANTSEGSSSTGMRSIVARAAPVSMLVEPGPIEAVTAKVWSRFLVRA